jgi:hypothetical protein
VLSLGGGLNSSTHGIESRHAHREGSHPVSIPTCKTATPGILFTEGCPSYVKADYLVINGMCDYSEGAQANGPGPCD